MASLYIFSDTLILNGIVYVTWLVFGEKWVLVENFVPMVVLPARNRVGRGPFV